MTATVADISALKEKLGHETFLVMQKAARWRAMGNQFPRTRRSFHRSADAMAEAAAAAAIIQEESQDPYLLAIALDDMRSYVNAD
jgi:hypothetical protein